eukprot:gene6461-3095_t
MRIILLLRTDTTNLTDVASYMYHLASSFVILNLIFCSLEFHQLMQIAPPIPVPIYTPRYHNRTESLALTPPPPLDPPHLASLRGTTFVESSSASVRAHVVQLSKISYGLRLSLIEPSRLLLLSFDPDSLSFHSLSPPRLLVKPSSEGVQEATAVARDWRIAESGRIPMCLAISLCELLRVGLAYSEFMWPLVAVETVLLWVKAAFFGLAVDGLGTFIYMLVRIVMGMRYFLLLLVIMWVMFGVALMNLFAESHVYGLVFGVALLNACAESNVYGDAPPNSPDYNETYGNTLDPREDTIFVSFSTFGRALMTSYMVTYGSTDYGPLEPYPALATRHPVIAVILICLFNFVIILLFMSILITLYGELYRQIRAIQDFVFLENRADLVIEVESTMSDAELEARKMPPFLHLLTPIKAGDQDDDDNEGDEVMKSTKLLEDALRKSEHPDMKHYLARRIKSVPEEEEPQISPHSEYDDGYEEQQALVFDELSHEVSRLRSLIDSLAIRVKTRRSLDESDGLTGELSSMLHRLGTLSTGIAQHAVSANSPEVRTSKIAFA